MLQGILRWRPFTVTVQKGMATVGDPPLCSLRGDLSTASASRTADSASVCRNLAAFLCEPANKTPKNDNRKSAKSAILVILLTMFSKISRDGPVLLNLVVLSRKKLLAST
jgi:hypothetical protein